MERETHHFTAPSEPNPNQKSGITDITDGLFSLRQAKRKIPEQLNSCIKISLNTIASFESVSDKWHNTGFGSFD